jgi:hypothetical protein
VELNNLYFSSGTIRPIKSRTMRWAGLEASMEEMTNAHTVWVGKKGGNYL